MSERLSLAVQHLADITRPDHTIPIIGDDDGGQLVLLEERGLHGRPGGTRHRRRAARAPGLGSRRRWGDGRSALDTRHDGVREGGCMGAPRGHAVARVSAFRDWWLCGDARRLGC